MPTGSLHFWRAACEFHCPTLDTKTFNGIIGGIERPPKDYCAVGVVTVMKKNTLKALQAGRVREDIFEMEYNPEWAISISRACCPEVDWDRL